LKCEQVATLKCASAATLAHERVAGWSCQSMAGSMRICTHDRLIDGDGFKCWHVGCSTKEAGNKAFMLRAVEDVGNFTALLKQVGISWQVGKPAL
jgi:hypothetical protein